MFDFLYRQIETLPVLAQEFFVLGVLLLPTVATCVAVTVGYNPLRLATAMLWRFRWTNFIYVALIAVSGGIGVGIIAQERGIREGTARAADPFDLVIAAPGSEITMMLASVYLQPSDVSLLSGEVFNEVANSDDVKIAAPLAFGDSYRAYPVIGTTQELLDHVSSPLQEGRQFQTHTDAIIGANVGLEIGQSFSPSHGVGHAADSDAHSNYQYVITGRMQATGSPWDRAIVVPIESVWEVHGLASGHAPANAGQLGPPFDPEYFPGTPAIIVSAEQLHVNYAVRARFNTSETMAFFPGTVLANLHALLGDVRQIMSVMAIVTQFLVAAGVLAGLAILTKLFARRLALLRALGAPTRFVFGVIWTYALALTAIGALTGLAVGYFAVGIISQIISSAIDISVRSSLGWTEIHLVAVFVSVAALMALVPALIAITRAPVLDLRGG